MKDTKIAHVSLTQRYIGDKFEGGGGVEKFAMFLQMAIPEVKIYSWASFDYKTIAAMDAWECADVMNTALLESGEIDEDTIVIGDGFWVHGLEGKVARLISVVHGSYWGTVLEHEKTPFGEEHVAPWALKQEEIWRDNRVEVVAVSEWSAQELYVTCGIEADAILTHGVPQSIYTLPDTRNQGQILHVAVSGRKGNEMVEKIKHYDKFSIEQLGYAETGTFEEESDLWGRGEVFFQPALYEGNSYALLEAMACGLVPVCYATGYARSLPSDVAIVTDDHHEVNYAMLLMSALEDKDSYKPREWIEEIAVSVTSGTDGASILR